jgi:Uri superfamily endonuclease
MAMAVSPKPDNKNARTATPGAYVLVIDLAETVAFETAVTGAVMLPAGRYGYCGSARGAGGIGARVRRHLRRDKTIHWHVDRLTAVGQVIAVHAAPGGLECDLLRRLLAVPGVTIPAAGFGSSDCRRCPAHLVALPPGFDPAVLGRR